MRKLAFLTLAFVVSLAAAGQQKKTVPEAPKPFVLGTIRELWSNELGEIRKLNIYLPEGYNPADTVHYPVVYLLDGSADEDFIHIVGLYQFYAFPWIEKVRPSIVVGIASVDRRRDFTYPTTIEKLRTKYPTTGGSARFISFIAKELQPYIEKNFPTTKARTLIGQSLGGLLATEILFTQPRLFTNYIIVSPSLWWDDGTLLARNPELVTPEFNQDINVYVAVGKEGLVPGDHPRVMEVDANMLADKIAAAKNSHVHVFFDYLPQEDHATILHQAVSNALRLPAPNATKN